MRANGIFSVAAFALVVLACTVNTDLGGALLLCGLPPERACPQGFRCADDGFCRDLRADAGGADGGVAVDGGPPTDGGGEADGGVADGGVADGGVVDAGLVIREGVVATDYYHSCAVSEGRLSCWGANQWGMLGSGLTEFTTGAPTRVELLGVEMVATALGHTCAIASGAVYCFGLSEDGRVGALGLFNTPRLVTIGGGCGNVCPPVVHVATGRSHTCAVRGGDVYCWGSNDSGQLGTATDGGPSEIPLRVAGVSGALRVGAGSGHSCALLDGGGVSCWGTNAGGELGVGTFEARQGPVSVLLRGAATGLGVGSGHSCAILAQDGALQCWGAGQDGQLGLAVAMNRATPVVVPSLTGVAAVSVNGRHTCAVRSDGSLHCWGANENGQLGVGHRAQRNAPQRVTGLAAVTAVGAGGTHTCARRADGRVLCWGGDWNGQLGSEVRARVGPVPVMAEGPPPVPLPRASQLALGEAHSCALVSVLGDGAVWCWGDGRDAQLGALYDPPYYDGSLYEVPLDEAPAELVSGASHACARSGDGGVACWGRNGAGQLGAGDLLNHPVPVQVVNLPGIERIAAGWYHTCAIVAGRVRCWGYNSDFQLGRETGAPEVTEHLSAGPPDGGVTALALGGTFSCALLGASGTVECWGRNDYRVLGVDPGPSVPGTSVRVATVSNATAIAAGYRHACAIIGSGSASTARCWGHGSYAQLGNGATPADSLPVDVMNLRGISALALGGDHSCALVADGGTVHCWGSNAHGQCGSGVAGDPNATVALPAAVPGLGGVGHIAAGAYHSCATLADGGTTHCWGYDMGGQLGTGSPHFRVTPVLVLPLP